VTRFRLRHLPLALAAAFAVGAAGCGGEEPQAALLSQGRADTLLGLLDDAQNQFQDGECDTLEQETLPELEETVAGVSTDVDSGFRTALDQETQELQELAEDCEQAEPEPTEEVAPPPAPETTVPPEPVEPVEPVVPEEPPEEEPPPPEEEEEPPPPEEDNSGEGNGQEGNGSSGSSGSGSGEVEPPGGVAPPAGAGASPGSGGGGE
jgi:outer membrane biosynthesis protein TonB